MKKQHVFQLFLQYTNEHRETGLSVLNELSGRLFPNSDFQTIAIDNSLVGDLELEIAYRNDLIPGDNSTREFSGWDKGLAWAAKKYRLRYDDTIILANDTFHRSYGTDYLALFDQKVASEVSSGAIVGYVDEFPEAIKLFDMDLKYWIRSSLIIGKFGVLRRILPMTIPAQNEQLFAPEWQEFFSPQAPLSENYQRFLRTWLFGEKFADGVFNEAWHSQQALSPENIEAMKAKARCILCEHYFSARMIRSKIPMYNVCRQMRM